MARMRTLPAVIAVGSTLAVATALSIGVASAATTPAVQFTKIQYNSPGSDTRTNASLNGEWFQVTNKTTKPVSLTGWTVQDVAKHTYKLSGTLAAGKTITVHTGKGTLNKPSGHRYWGSGNYIWNNTGDTATLRNGSGKTVHSCSWKSTGSVTTCGTTTPRPPVPQPSTSRPPAASPTTTTPAATPPTPPGDGTGDDDLPGDGTPSPIIG